MAGESREFGRGRGADVGHEVEQEILELIFLGAVDRQLAEDDPADVAQQPGGAEVHKALVGDRHGVARLLEKENRVARIHLVGRADGLLDQ